MKQLSEISLAPKQVQRITSQIGSDRVDRRVEEVQKHRERPLMQRVTAAPQAERSELAVVMMDGGRYQRRDHFRNRGASARPGSSSSEPEKKTHWREEKVGIVLSMQSDVSAEDPAPEFPEWLAGAGVVAEIAQLAAREEEASETTSSEPARVPAANDDSCGDDLCGWEDLAPEVLSRDVIASSEDSETFGWHWEWQAWTLGVQAAKRQAFVADGLAVNWTIHKQHFSQMTGILDLMHALSYAWRAAAAVADDPEAYRRYATWIWQGKVQQVIDELMFHQAEMGLPVAGASAADPRERIGRAITYYTNQAHLMNDPDYRRQGLPLTSSLMESTIKQMNARIKGSEKFWNRKSGESVLQLRADSLSDSEPLDEFWANWRNQQTGTNTYRKLAA